MVVLEKPAFFSASRSFVIPLLLRLEPIHSHKTPGLAASGGLLKTAAGSLRSIFGYPKHERQKEIRKAENEKAFMQQQLYLLEVSYAAVILPKQ
jgi:hypothetical protein